MKVVHARLHARKARVPLVVVMAIGRAAIFDRVNSRGELPRSKAMLPVGVFGTGLLTNMAAPGTGHFGHSVRMLPFIWSVIYYVSRACSETDIAGHIQRSVQNARQRSAASAANSFFSEESRVGAKLWPPK